MSAFRELEGDSALLLSNGVFRQVPLYERNGVLFAKWGAGFVRLTQTGATSAPAVQFTELVYEGPLFADAFGRLALAPADGRKALLPQPGALPLPAPEE